MIEYTRYFTSYEGYFWQWEEEGNVLAIPNGPTIAYEEFLLAAMERMAGEGLQQFGSILLAIIATNEDGKNALKQVGEIVRKKISAPGELTSTLDEAIRFLEILAAVPSKYKKGKNRILLIHTIFSGSHNQRSAKNSGTIISYYKSRIRNGSNFFAPEKIFPFDVYLQDFKPVALLLRKFPTVESILEKLAGVPLVEEEIQVEPTGPEKSEQRDFVDELIDNSKTFHIGSLIKRLWSGLNIPFHNYLPSQHPVGGVSDLSNKGEFHRLLISEFANDDLLFLSRLANNEALYINREIPPDHQEPERVILIDISMKSWGTPRTLAYALAIAIAKHPKTDIHCSVFAVGSGYYPVSLESIDNIIDGLQLLEAGLHPVAGLERFFKEYPFKKRTEIFLVASEDSYRLPALHKCISDHYSLFSYWITADASGGIDIYKRQQNSKRHVQRLQLPLEEAWNKKTTKKKSTPSASFTGKYPILFPPVLSPKKLLPLGEELFMITQEKALFRCTNPTKQHVSGWEMIHEHVQISNGEATLGLNADGEYLLLVFNYSNRTIRIMNLHTKEQDTYHFAGWKKSVYNEFLFHDGRFYYCYLGYPSHYWSFKLDEGISVSSFENIPKELTDLYKQLVEERKKLVYKPDHFSIFKNARTVFINQVGNLVFNSLELTLDNKGVIRLAPTGFTHKEISADYYHDGVFKFQDGSTVTFNRPGVIILKSSDSDIDTIYIPSVVDRKLGIATNDHFAGNDYFFNPKSGAKETTPSLVFWRNYMQPFINQITKHATPAKAIR